MWINLDTPEPDHKMSPSRNIANALIRRRSQLSSRLRRFRNVSGFSAVWTCKSDSRMLQPPHHPEISEFQRLLPHRASTNVGQDFQVVLTSHQQLLLPASTRGDSKCDGCQETANRLPSLSVSKLTLKSRDQLPCTTKEARNPCVRDCETFSGIRRAPQCQCSFGSCGYHSTCWTFRRCADDSS